MPVSIIVPTYNYGEFIGETLSSLLEQTYPDWNCIVVDDGSTDDTRRVVESFVSRDSRFRYIHQNNAGVAAARNNALRYADGDYVQFLDADDLIGRRKLEVQVSFLNSNPQIDLIYGEARYFRTGNPNERRFSMFEPDVEWMPKLSGEGAGIIEAILKNNIFTINSPLV